MFTIFNRKVVTKHNEQNAKQEAIATHIYSTITKFQQRGAGFLQHKTDRLSKLTKICLLIAFCSISTGYSIYRFKNGFTKNSASLIRVDRFIDTSTIQKHYYPLSNYKNQGATDTYNRLQQFLNYLDSLNRTASGRRIQDSILNNRPGLLDSIQHIEKMFQSPSIKK